MFMKKSIKVKPYSKEEERFMKLMKEKKSKSWRCSL